MLSVCKMPNFKKKFDEDLKLFVNNVMNLIKYDTAKIIMFNYDKSHILTKFSIYKDEKNFTQAEGELINIDKDSTKNVFKLLLEKKEAIICSFLDCDYYGNNNYKPFVENIKNEMYVPLFDNCGIDINVIGCLYLGSYDAYNFVEKEDLLKEEFIKNIRYIQGIFYYNYLNEYIEKQFLSITNIMDDILKVRASFMNNHNYNVAYWSDLIANKLAEV